METAQGSEQREPLPETQPGAASVSPRDLRCPPNLLREVLEEVPIRGHLEDLEAGGREMVLIPGSPEPAREAKRRLVRQARERGRQEQRPAGPDQAGQLADDRDRIGDMFQSLGTERRVEGGIGLRDRGDVGDDVGARGILYARLQADVASAVILREVLTDVLEVSTRRAVRLFAGARVENSPGGWNGRQLTAHPIVAVPFVVRPHRWRKAAKKTANHDQKFSASTVGPFAVLAPSPS